MEQKIWAFCQHALFWIDDTSVIIISQDAGYKNGHCELVNTVSKVPALIKSFVTSIFQANGDHTKINVDGTFITAVKQM